MKDHHSRMGLYAVDSFYVLQANLPLAQELATKYKYLLRGIFIFYLLLLIILIYGMMQKIFKVNFSVLHIHCPVTDIFCPIMVRLIGVLPKVRALILLGTSNKYERFIFFLYFNNLSNGV